MTASAPAPAPVPVPVPASHLDLKRDHPDPLEALSFTKFLGYKEINMATDVTLIKKMWCLGEDIFITDNKNSRNGDTATLQQLLRTQLSSATMENSNRTDSSC